MLISEEYRRLNEEKHKASKGYGIYGGDKSGQVMELANVFNTIDLLDYGCGKGTLSKQLPFPIQQYDPCVPRYNREPHPADIVVCTDVLEHVEPECVDDVLDHMRSLSRKAVFILGNTVESRKSLSDGSSTHRTIRPYYWWVTKLMMRWRMQHFQYMDRGFRFIGDTQKADGEDFDE